MSTDSKKRGKVLRARPTAREAQKRAAAYRKPAHPHIRPHQKRGVGPGLKALMQLAQGSISTLQAKEGHIIYLPYGFNAAQPAELFVTPVFRDAISQKQILRHPLDQNQNVEIPAIDNPELRWAPCFLVAEKNEQGWAVNRYVGRFDEKSHFTGHIDELAVWSEDLDERLIGRSLQIWSLSLANPAHVTLALPQFPDATTIVPEGCAVEEIRLEQ